MSERLTDRQEAVVAAAAKCLELAARERATLAHMRINGADYTTLSLIQEAIKRLENASHAIMELFHA